MAPLRFEELFIDYSGIPELQEYPTRNGSRLGVRHYPSESSRCLILIHGSGYQSRYLYPLAMRIAAAGAAQVYTPDLRGHGPKPERRGDIDSLNQFEEDLIDLVREIQKQNPECSIAVGGHSSGGGLALRFASTAFARGRFPLLMIAPFLKHNAPTMREGTGGWAQPQVGRIVLLSILTGFGITAFNHLPVISFHMPEEVRDGTETLSYSFRLNTAYAPRNYKKELARLKAPVLVVAGSEDEVFHGPRYPATVSPHAPHASFAILEGASHMGAVVGQESSETIVEWLRSLV